MQSSHGSKAMLILRACSGLQTSGYATAMDSGLMIRDTYIERERERETHTEREREREALYRFHQLRANQVHDYSRGQGYHMHPDNL